MSGLGMTTTLEVLRGLEWSGRATGASEGLCAGPVVPACPECHGVSPDDDCDPTLYFPPRMIGHKDWCDLQAAIKRGDDT